MRRLAAGHMECRPVVADALGLEPVQAPFYIGAERVEHGPDIAEHRLDLRSGIVPIKRGAQAGFTLLEIMIVLIIAGLALGLVVTRGSPRSPGLQPRLAASEVAQGLRVARSRAITLNRPVGFTLDIARHSWHIDGGASQALPAELDLGLLTVAGSSRDSGNEAGRIVFAPDGSSSGGTIELAGVQTRLAVGVDWLTGRVAVARVR